MLLSVIALTSCLDTLKQYCFHMYPNDYEYNDDYLKYGFSDYILKPLEKDKFLEKINKCLK